MFLTLERNPGNDFLWPEIVEELACRKLQASLQLLRECSEPCNYVWIAYTILSHKAFSSRVQTCYCGTSGYVPRPIGYEQSLLHSQPALDQDSADTHQLVVPTESHGYGTLSDDQVPTKPVRRSPIRPIIPLNFAALHPPTWEVIPKKDGFRLSATSVPFVPSSGQSSSLGVSGGEVAGTNSGSLLVKNEQFTDEAGEGGGEGVMLGSVRECEVCKTQCLYSKVI
jgi:hypothetical protein